LCASFSLVTKLSVSLLRFSCASSKLPLETARSPLDFVHTFGLVLYASTKAIGSSAGATMTRTRLSMTAATTT
jgi:hypothetical protein